MMKVSPTIVPAVGPRSARILLVGEAPGRDEDAQGEPFIGASGQLLNGTLATVGINRKDCYITNVVKQRPDKNDFGIFYKDKSRKTPTEFLESSWESLHEEIRKVKPNIVVALGAEAFRALCPQFAKPKISDWRGSVVWSEATDSKVLCTYHPSYILRMAHEHPIFTADLSKAKRHSEHREYNPPAFPRIIWPTFDQTIEWLSRDHTEISIDIETIDNHIRCVGIATAPSFEAICIPFMQSWKHPPHIEQTGAKTVIKLPEGQADGVSYWSPEQEEAILTKLKHLFQNPKVRKVLQNFPFDSTHISRWWGIEILGLHLDTMYLHHACWPELPKGLDYLVSVYTDHPCYWDHDPSVDEEEWVYNCLDCSLTLFIGKMLQREAEELGVWHFYKTHIQPCMIELTRMQNRGILIDKDFREELKKAIETSEAEALQKVKALAKESHPDLEDYNPNSYPQTQKFFYEGLKLPIQYSRKTKGITTDAEAMVRLAKKAKTDQQKEAVQAMTDYRNHSKLMDFVTQKVDSDGRMRTSFNVAGTKNGRISSSKTTWGTGANLLNMPKRKHKTFRRQFKADPGHVFIKVDLDGAESRAVAWLAPIPYLQMRFRQDGFKVHRWNAANIFMISEDEVTPEQYDIGKIGIHGGNYGLSPRGAAAQYDVPLKDAERSLNAYWDAAPEVKMWWGDIKEQLHRTRTLTSPWGRRRTFFGRFNDEMYRSAYSFLPQAIVGDIINRALFLAPHVLAAQGGIPVLQVYDEIVFQVPEENVDQALRKIKRLMEPPIYLREGESPLVIPCDPEVGPNWCDTVPVQVPNTGKKGSKTD